MRLLAEIVISGRRACQAEAGRRLVACKSQPKVDRPSYFQTLYHAGEGGEKRNEVAGTMAIIAEGPERLRRNRRFNHGLR